MEFCTVESNTICSVEPPVCQNYSPWKNIFKNITTLSDTLIACGNVADDALWTNPIKYLDLLLSSYRDQVCYKLHRMMVSAS